MYEFKFYTPEESNPNLQVLEYYEDPDSRAPNTTYNANGTSPRIPPTLKTLILDTTRKTFVGCSAGFGDLVRSSVNSTPERLDLDIAKCSEGNGTYEKGPYLHFTINNSTSDPTSTVHIQAESREWAYDNDAPSFSLLRYTRDPRTTPEDSKEATILLRSALTKRNSPSVLKVCASEDDISLEVLGPLSVMMGALNRFSVFISRRRIFSTV
jgi:hypothetical protein